MALQRMKRWFPTISYPLIISAPMDNVANAHLATEASRAGGLGFIQGGRDFSAGSPIATKLEKQLSEARDRLSWDAGRQGPLPIGVGFVLYSPTIDAFAETAGPILRAHKPAAVWLFAPDPERSGVVASVVRALRSPGVDWGTRIVVQVGSVAAARSAVEDGADVVVAQGVDAGGHQWAQGAGIVSLVPEIADMLAREFRDRDVGLWAAGGIADGRGVAASLALGAEGAVLGTRFMVSTESSAQDYKKEAILSTADGGVNTVKSQIHDHIQGNKDWPALYDGRAVIHPSYRDQQAGVPLDENTDRFNAARQTGDLSRMVTWSGTGVGLIKESMPAAKIVRQLQEEAIKAIASMKSN